jgi:hypothetical protein
MTIRIMFSIFVAAAIVMGCKLVLSTLDYVLGVGRPAGRRELKRIGARSCACDKDPGLVADRPGCSEFLVIVRVPRGNGLGEG